MWARPWARAQSSPPASAQPGVARAPDHAARTTERSPRRVLALERLRDREHLAVGAERLHGAVPPVARQLDRRFEAGLRSRRASRELVARVPRQPLPALHVRGAVPADVDLPVRDCDRRDVLRMPVPHEPVRAIRVRVLAGLLAVAEVRVEEDLAVLAQLADVRPAAPADEDVAVGEELRVALERRQQLLRMVVAAHEGGALVLLVEPQQQDARLLVHRRGRAVVEDRDRPVRLAADIVLPREARTRAERERALLAAQP